MSLGDEFIEIPLDKIFWASPIRDITKEDIRDMAASIVVHNLIEPIVVKPANEEGMYEGVVGRLRYEGMKHRWRGNLEGKTILARVHDFKDDIEVRMWQLAENLHRRELPAMEKARAYRELYDNLQKKTVVSKPEATVSALAKGLEELTGDKTAEKTVYHYLNLTNLAPEAQEILTREKLSLRHGLELLRVKDPKKQVELAKWAAKERFTFKQLKNNVDWVLAEERTERHNKRLQKKAEELRAEGKIVYVGRFISWKERKKFHEWWGETPEECKDCEKLGILLEANFHQKEICTDPSCWKKKEEERRKKEREEEEKLRRVFTEEQAKVYEMEPDVRHWRLALYGLIDNWHLKDLLELKRGEWDPGGLDVTLWKMIQDLDEEKCKKLLIRHAVESILTGPQRWRGEDPAKTWAVEEFGLTREVFLSPQKEETLPCDDCARADTCDRTFFYAEEDGTLTCDMKVLKKE